MTEQSNLLEVEGMSCPSCIDDIRALLSKIDGVRHVEVQLDDGLVRVNHVGGLPIANLIEKLADGGYVSKPVRYRRSCCGGHP